MSQDLLEADACQCGHPRAAHLHLRSGTDCSLCDRTCARYRPCAGQRRFTTRLRTVLHRHHG